MEGQIIKRRNVYTSYGRSIEVVVSLDEVVNGLKVFNTRQGVTRGDVERELLREGKIWTINWTYFLKGGTSNDARQK